MVSSMEHELILHELAGLSAKLNALSAEVEALRSALQDARGRVDLSMRGQSLCPTCGSRELLYARQVLDKAGAPTPMQVRGIEGFFRHEYQGTLAIYICRRCGLCEWYVSDPASIAPDGDVITAIEGRDSTDSGPYR